MQCVQMEALLVDNTASATCLEHSEILATPRIPVHVGLQRLMSYLLLQVQASVSDIHEVLCNRQL